MACFATSHSVKRLKLPTVYSCAILLSTLLVACLPGAANKGRQREDLANLVSALAAPEDAVLLTQTEGVSQGSQEECQFVYVERLYGTQQPFEDIRIFYEQTLAANRWQKNIMLSDATGLSFERADGFVLGVYDDETASHISRSQIKDIQLEFTTVYLVSAVYAAPTTWKRCGQRVGGGK